MMRDPECYTPEQSQSRSEMAVLIQVFSGKVFRILIRTTVAQSRSPSHCLELVFLFLLDKLILSN